MISQAERFPRRARARVISSSSISKGDPLITCQTVAEAKGSQKMHKNLQERALLTKLEVRIIEPGRVTVWSVPGNTHDGIRQALLRLRRNRTCLISLCSSTSLLRLDDDVLSSYIPRTGHTAPRPGLVSGPPPFDLQYCRDGCDPVGARFSGRRSAPRLRRIPNTRNPFAR